ncbi:MAG: dihydrolipoyl dehydrogenase [Gammaproteobacteria bacterium]
MSDHYDVAVIGSGPGGYSAAIRSGQLGKSVICIEKCGTDQSPIFGGTCLNVGCIPSKALLDSSYEYHKVLNHASTHGINLNDISLDLNQMLTRKESVVSDLTKGVAGLFKLNKVKSIRGFATVKKDLCIEITDEQGSLSKISADNVILATGSKPVELDVAPSDKKNIITSKEALNLDQVSHELVIIGSGAIGLEIGSIWSRLGSKVTILEEMEELLPQADVQVSKEALKIFKDQGLDIKLGTKIESVKKSKDKIQIKFGEESIEADKLIIAAGRVPYLENLLDEDINLEIDSNGSIKVNSLCETNLTGMYAIGDAVRGPKLAHKASEEGVMVAENIAGLNTRLDYDLIPYVIYTHPEIAWVGMNEARVEEINIDYEVASFPFSLNGRSLANNEKQGFVKMVVDRSKDSILGVHIIGSNASELIQQAIIAIKTELSAEAFGSLIFSHPTTSEAIKEAASLINSKAIHISNRKRKK